MLMNGANLSIIFEITKCFCKNAIVWLFCTSISNYMNKIIVL